MALFRLNLVPEDVAVPFISWRKIAAGISITLVIGSLALLGVRGLNFGIDFVGGTLVQIEMPGEGEEEADLQALRAAVGEIGFEGASLQGFGGPRDVLIRLKKVEGDGVEGERAQQAAAERLIAGLEERYPGIRVDRTEVVGGVVSGQLVQAGILAVSLALVAMLIYITLRFEWQFAVGAVLALAHDVILTLGVFALTGLEFNLPIIAAILTIIGYSMNDTVVVYDRVREKLRKFKKMALPDLLNLAVNKTLARTVVTSVTTLIALVSLFILGGEVLRGFSFAMIFGVVVGTYSSIFIAAPALLLTGVDRPETEDGAAPAPAKA